MGKAFSWIAIAIATAVVSILTFGVGTVAIVIAITVAGVSAYAIGESVVAQQAQDSVKNEKQDFVRQAESNLSPTHGQYFANDWNYMEKITTDFDRETMTCKRCITARKCKESRWSIMRNRYCVSWEKWEEEPRCNELQF